MGNLSDKQAAFVREYLLSGNASDAYRKAGYATKNEASTAAAASRLLKDVKVSAAVAAGRKKVIAKIEAEFGIRLDDILTRLAAQATADRRELTTYRRGACRYCHGLDHRYQWRTHREYADAMEAYMLKGEAYHANHTPPDNEGGDGYRFKRPPHPDCPECEGDGIGRTFFADLDSLSPEAAVTFEGVQETKDGLKYVMADRTKALEILGKHLGLADKARDAGIDALARGLADIASRGSAMPIRSMDDEEDVEVDP